MCVPPPPASPPLQSNLLGSGERDGRSDGIPSDNVICLCTRTDRKCDLPPWSVVNLIFTFGAQSIINHELTIMDRRTYDIARRHALGLRKVEGANFPSLDFAEVTGSSAIHRTSEDSDIGGRDASDEDLFSL